MPLRFLTRLVKGKGHFYTFYVPKYVMDFYGLKPGSYKGGVALKNGTTASYRIWLSRYRNTLRGRVPESAAMPKNIVEIWMYPQSWIPSIRKPISTQTIASEWSIRIPEYIQTPSGYILSQ